MNWLLITTSTRTPERMDSNIGDEFARLGVQRIIRAVDLDATFDLLDKESTADWDRPHPFDRAIICGMPLFWSTPNQTQQDIWWWPHLWNSYIGQEKSRILALGVGHVLVGPPADPIRYQQGIDEVTAKTWRVVTREPIYGQDSSWFNGICPSAFCLLGEPVTRELRLCNLMPFGGHFGHLTPEGKRWEKEQAPTISRCLVDHGFLLVAHTQQELEYGAALGWPRDRIRCYASATEYLALYRAASCYFGNRLHGAVVCASTGAPVWAVTHDSRLGMVTRLGGIASLTAGVTPEGITQWLTAALGSAPSPWFSVPVQFPEMMALCRRFAAT